MAIKLNELNLIEEALETIPVKDGNLFVQFIAKLCAHQSNTT